MNVLKGNMQMVLYGDQSDIDNPYIIESQLKEYESRLKELVKLAASSDSDKRKGYYLEISNIGKRIEELKAKEKGIAMDTDIKTNSESICSAINSQDNQIMVFDDSLVRQLIEVIKVVDKGNIEVVFKGGVEIRNEEIVKEAL